MDSHPQVYRGVVAHIHSQLLTHVAVDEQLPWLLSMAEGVDVNILIGADFEGKEPQGFSYQGSLQDVVTIQDRIRTLLSSPSTTLGKAAVTTCDKGVMCDLLNGGNTPECVRSKTSNTTGHTQLNASLMMKTQTRADNKRRLSNNDTHGESMAPSPAKKNKMADPVQLKACSEKNDSSENMGDISGGQDGGGDNEASEDETSVTEIHIIQEKVNSTPGSGNLCTLTVAPTDNDALSSIKQQLASVTDPVERSRLQKLIYEAKTPAKYQCQQCSFRTKRQSHYKKHLSLHATKKPPIHSCDQCDYKTIRRAALTRHMQSHPSSGEVETDPSEGHHETEGHTEGRTVKGVTNKVVTMLVCDKCSYYTESQSRYTRHMECHRSDSGIPQRVLTCVHADCTYTARTKSLLRAHVKDKHMTSHRLLCDLCGTSFKRKYGLMMHRKYMHVNKEARPLRFTCLECGKKFRSKAHLREHDVTHTNKRAFLCETCGTAFKTKSAVKRHKDNVHNDGKQIVTKRGITCVTCKRMMPDKNALLQHLQQEKLCARTYIAKQDAQIKPYMTGEDPETNVYMTKQETDSSVHAIQGNVIEEGGDVEMQVVMENEVLVKDDSAHVTLPTSKVGESSNDGQQQQQQTTQKLIVIDSKLPVIVENSNTTSSGTANVQSTQSNDMLQGMTYLLYTE